MFGEYPEAKSLNNLIFNVFMSKKVSLRNVAEQIFSQKMFSSIHLSIKCHYSVLTLYSDHEIRIIDETKCTENEEKNSK